MKIPFLCNYLDCGVINPLDYADQDLYEYECVVCERKNAHAMAEERFELLFDFGALAFLNGYYRESVADFATALERFFEFFVRTVLHEQGLPDEATERTWKVMSNQSERQLGAVAALYLLIRKQPPDFLHKNTLQSEFRNKVLHKGYVPSRAETIEYAEAMHALIRRLLGELWEIAPRSTGRIRHDLTTQLGRRTEAEGYTFSVYHYHGMFGILRFHPEAIALTEESHRSYTDGVEPDGAGTGPEYLRTDLGFEDTLKARRVFLLAKFYDVERHGPAGAKLGEGVEGG